MAQENTVLLYGIALDSTKVSVNANGLPVRAQVFVRVVDRRQSNATTNEDEVRFGTVLVYSGRLDTIEALGPVEKGDLVTIYGSITTTSAKKKCKCPVCSSVIESQSAITYVSPIYACRREHGLSEEDAVKTLKNSYEISNRVSVIGNICADPQYYDNNGESVPTLEYQIALPRTVRVHDDTADERTDFPWVRVCGQQAVKDRDALMKGSQVYIKGHLRSRDVQKKIQCPHCGEIFTKSDYPLMFITPHFTEYIRNCNFPDAEGEVEE